MSISLQPEILIGSETGNGKVLREGVSFEEFLRWDGENQHVEWVDGNVIAKSPVSEKHQEVLYYLVTLLSNYALWQRCGRVLGEPYVMRTGPQLPSRAPDILFVTTPNMGRIRRTYLDGPADLAIEIVSPDDPKRDYVVKLDEYQRGGVLEYWIIDPEQELTLFHELVGGKYRLGTLEADGSYHSLAVPGFWLRPHWLWQRPLPDMFEIQREWQLI